MSMPHVVRSDQEKGLIAVLRRRRDILVPGLLLSLILGVVLASFSPLQYTSRTTAVLVQPSGSRALIPLRSENPLLTFDQGLETTSSILIQILNDPAVADQLGVVRGEESYLVSPSAAGASAGTSAEGGTRPFISIAATARSPQAGTDLVGRVLARAQFELSQRQEQLRVRKSNAVRIFPVTGPTPAKTVWSAPIIAFGASVILGFLLTIGGALVVDRGVRPLLAGGRPELGGVVDDPGVDRGAAVARVGVNQSPKTKTDPTRSSGVVTVMYGDSAMRW